MKFIQSIFVLFQDCRQYIFETPFHTRRGGGGAPLRNAAGKILTTYREDASITFQEPTRSYVDNHLRYKKSAEGKRKYKMELDECISTKDRMNGKIPWRKSKAAGKSFMKSMVKLESTLNSRFANIICALIFIWKKGLDR